jgi:hypothetical protein
MTRDIEQIQQQGGNSESIMKFTEFAQRSLINADPLTKSMFHAITQDDAASALRMIQEKGFDKNSSVFFELFCVGPIHIAVIYGSLNLLIMLLNEGVSIESPSLNGNTPLLLAVCHGNYEVAEYLLFDGANRDAICVAGWTPLHMAAHRDNFDMVRLLLDSGADVNIRDEEGLLAQEMFKTSDEIKAAIIDEPRHRIQDHGMRRATEESMRTCPENET